MKNMSIGLNEGNPFCDECLEENCLIDPEGTCSMIRIYLEKKGLTNVLEIDENNPFCKECLELEVGDKIFRLSALENKREKWAFEVVFSGCPDRRAKIMANIFTKFGAIMGLMIDFMEDKDLK
jgi:hypothetical protein